MKCISCDNEGELIYAYLDNLLVDISLCKEHLKKIKEVNKINEELKDIFGEFTSVVHGVLRLVLISRKSKVPVGVVKVNTEKDILGNDFINICFDPYKTISTNDLYNFFYNKQKFIEKNSLIDYEIKTDLVEKLYIDAMKIIKEFKKCVLCGNEDTSYHDLILQETDIALSVCSSCTEKIVKDEHRIVEAISRRCSYEVEEIDKDGIIISVYAGALQVLRLKAMKIKENIKGRGSMDSFLRKQEIKVEFLKFIRNVLEKQYKTDVFELLEPAFPQELSRNDITRYFFDRLYYASEESFQR